MEVSVHKFDPSADWAARFAGLYDVPEAARILLASDNSKRLYPVDSRKLIRWLRKGLADKDLVDVPGRDLVITFEDLVSLRVIAALRSAGVGFKRITDAETYLRDITQHPKPFATQLLWTDHSHVFATLKSQLVSASRHGQLAMRIMERYLIPVHGLKFGNKGIAESWEPHPGVALVPEVQFGAACIKGTRIPTRAIFNSISGGDSVSRLAQAYGVSQKLVQEAIAWEERLAA